jgi:hypothetical protein
MSVHSFPFASEAQQGEYVGITRSEATEDYANDEDTAVSGRFIG